MAIALGPLKNKIVHTHMDDLLIGAIEWEQFLERVELLLEALVKANLTLRLSKCLFGARQVNFLGFHLSADGIRPGEVKTEAIRAFPRPTDVHAVRRFIGLTSFFRKFIRSYATKAEPLTRLTRKDTPFQWTSAQEGAFQQLRDELLR